MISLTKVEVAQIVRSYVSGRQFDGMTLEVVEKGIYKMNGYWRVPVRPDAWPKSISAYYEAMAEVEAEISEKEHLPILLASGDPEEDEEAPEPATVLAA